MKIEKKESKRVVGYFDLVALDLQQPIKKLTEKERLDKKRFFNNMNSVNNSTRD